MRTRLTSVLSADASIGSSNLKSWPQRMLLLALMVFSALLFVQTASAACTPPPTGLVGWWAGEGNANDQVGTNNGTLLNGATFASGTVGSAFSFDGLDDVVEVPNSSAISFGPTNAMTVELWVYRTTSNSVAHILGKRVGCAPTIANYQMAWDPIAGLQFNAGTNVAGVSTGIELPMRTWVHLAATFDGTIFSFYINGQVVATASGTLGAPNNAPLVIGGTAECARFGGLLDEVSIYNRALGSSEIAAIYTAGAAGKCPAPPAFILQPQNCTNSAGSSATFTAVASGAQPLTYQWYFNGSILPAVTGTSCTLSNVTAVNSGTYSVTVSNAVGAITSSNAVLTVYQPVCTSTPAGLVSWWSGEGGANDLVGTNNGVLRNGAGFASGKVGLAFVLNGTSQYVDVPNSPALNPTTALSVEAWVYPQLPYGSVASPIIKKAGEGTLTQDGYALEILSTGRAQFSVYVSGGRGWVSSSSALLATNQWNHVAGVFDGTKVSLYVNGALVGTPVSAVGQIVPSSNNLQFGHDASHASWYLKGMIDEPSVYNTALSGSQIYAIYDAAAGGKCSISPSFTAQPQSSTRPTGATASFTAAATGTQPLSYQWLFNGTIVSGATGTTCSLSNLTTANSGTYTVVVTNIAGSITSSNAVLTVYVPPCAPPTSGLMSWWRAEGNGDDSIDGNSSSLRNGTSFTTGLIGQAFRFSGTNQFVFITNKPSLIPTGSFSIAGWIYPQQDAMQIIFEKWGDRGDQPNQRCYAFHMAPGLILHFAISDAAKQWDTAFQTFTTASNAVPLNAWSHVAATYDQSTGTRRIYVNGVQVAARTDTPITVLNGTAPACIGASLLSSTYTQDYFKGSIDELAFYHRALSADEIQGIYSASAAGQCATAPAFTVQPQSCTNEAGSSVTFTAAASGTQPLTYQWLFNGGILSGVTGTSCTLSNLSTDNSGTYTVVVTNVAGSITSSNAALTIYTPVCTPAPTGLVSWWSGEGNGNDSIGGNQGWLRNGVSFIAGKVGQAFSFSGSGQFVFFTNQPSLNPTGSFSIEGWVFPKVAAQQVILGKWTDSAEFPNQRSYVLNIRSDLSLQFSISDVANQGNAAFHLFPTAANVISTNSWSHVAAIYDQATGTRRIFVNGVQVAARTDTPITIFNSTVPVAIGASYYSTNSIFDYFNGTIDELAFYNRALSTNELQSIYSASAAGKCVIPTAPSFTLQPQSCTKPTGSSVTFTAAVSGTLPLSYQWLFNGSTLSGATGTSCTLSNLTTANAGTYSVVVSNAVGSVASSNAVLTVYTPVCAAPSGLVSWWRGEGDGSDNIGGNHGVLRNGVSFMPGEVGQAFNFSGSGQFVFLTNQPSLNATGSFSIEGWVFPKVAAQQVILGKWTHSTEFPNQRSYVLNIRPDLSLQFSISDLANQGNASFHLFATAANVISTNTWSHVAAIYDQTTGTRRIYVNGVQVAQRTDTPITIFTSTVPAAIGASYYSTNSIFDYFNGMIDELAFYNRALSTSELQSIYTADAAGKCPVAAAFTLQPQGSTQPTGASVTFTAAASGSQPLTYQWFFNGAIVSGATGTSCTVSNLTTANAGSYSCVASNVAGPVTSSNAVLTVELPSSLQFVLTGYSAAESNSAAIITVRRNGTSLGQVSVDYATAAGTATAGLDYTNVSGTLTWANGETADKTFAVPLVIDGIAEYAETVSLTLSNPSLGAVLGTPNTATLTIVDVDQNVATATQSSAVTAYHSPGRFTVSCQFGFPSGRQLYSLLWRPSLPAGWTVDTVSGDCGPTVEHGEILFLSALNHNPVQFSYTVTVPPTQSGIKQIGGTAEYQLDGMLNPVSVTATPLLSMQALIHSADYRSNYWVIDGTEASRVLTYWRAGAYHVDAAGLDGYGMGEGSTNGSLHTADYKNPVWHIDGTELNRVLAYWRAGCYQSANDGVDGFAACSSIIPQSYKTVSTLNGAAPVDATAMAASPVTASQSGPMIYPPGSTIQVTNQIVYSGSLLSLLWRANLPTNWTLQSVTGDGSPEAKGNEVVWTGSSVPPSPVNFVLTINVPVGEQRGISITGEAEYQPSDAINALSQQPQPDKLMLARLRFGQVTHLPDGRLQLQLLSLTNDICNIEVSSTLTNWTPLMTLTNASGCGWYIHPQATNEPRLYYRAVLP